MTAPYINIAIMLYWLYNDVGDFMETIIQFGEGNFLRAFSDYYIQLAKDGGLDVGDVVICQPRSNTSVINALNKQGCKYNVILRGKHNGAIVDEVKEINCISRCIDTIGEYNKLVDLFKSDNLKIVISNTTEAGICFNDKDNITDSPNVSFPAKVTALLYERYLAGKNGLVFLPVELIENNGDTLKKCVIDYISLWNLENGFLDFVENQCEFCNTLVDRIVTGYVPYNNDKCAVTCEPYASWLIQADDKVKAIFPLDKLNSGVTFVNNLSEYRARKVRILNGAHTMSVLAAYHMGFNIVRDMMNDNLMNKFIKKGLFEQIIPTINLPENELVQFANSVLERFDNPFIDHKILDISLNSVSKYKARCLDTLLDYKKITGKFPTVLCFALSSLIYFYNGKFVGDKFMGDRNGEQYEIRDSVDVIESFQQAYKSDDVVKFVLSNKNFWDIDLTSVDGLYELVKSYFDDINLIGVEETIKRVISYE